MVIAALFGARNKEAKTLDVAWDMRVQLVVR